MLIGLALFVAANAIAAEVVAVVSVSNPVTTLSKNQIMDIFLGKTGHFPDGSMAVPVDQDEGSAERDAFYLNFAGKSPAQLKAYWSKIIFTGRGQPPREVSNGIEVKKFVAGHRNAIGYIERDLADSSVKVLFTQ